MKIGADPELFLFHPEQEAYHSAYGVIPGTKENPYAVEKGAVQVDGMALEFNIDPVEDCESFVSNISTVLSQMQTMLPAGHTMAVEAVAEFGNKYIREQPKEARELGCDPDFNAYTGYENPQPEDIGGIRTASGHIHVGFLDDGEEPGATHFDDCRALVKQLDYFLGLPALALDNKQRRTMYGKAGAFRPKSYGVEYRVLSNFWISAPSLMRAVYNATTNAVYYLHEGINMTEKFGPVEDIINRHDIGGAVDFIERNKLYDFGIQMFNHRALRRQAPGGWAIERDPDDNGIEEFEVVEDRPRDIRVEGFGQRPALDPVRMNQLLQELAQPVPEARVQWNVAGEAPAAGARDQQENEG